MDTLTASRPLPLSHCFPWKEAKVALEEQGWFILPSFLPSQINGSLLESFQHKLQNDQFRLAKVGKDLQRSLEKKIRLSQTAWIESWDESAELKALNDLFAELALEMNQHFFLNMKRWESQMALYPHGGFYKKHLDQLRSGENRIMTCIFYLNDCDDGGELVIYDRDDIKRKVATIAPRRGTCVIFFSRQIFHEVLPSFAPRFSLTTWLRHDQDPLLS